MRKRLAHLVIALLLLLCLGVAAFFYFLSDERVKSFITARGASGLGRDLLIGDLDIDWGWPLTSVRMEKVTIANIDGAAEPYMVNIAQADLRIHLKPLLWGRLEMPELRVTRPKIFLEKAGKDKNNWAFPAFSKTGAVMDAVLPDDRHGFPVIDRLVVVDGLLSYNDKIKDLAIRLSIDTATGAKIEEQRYFQLKGNGTLQKKNFELQAQGGSIELLRDTEKPYPLKFDLQMGSTRWSMEGTFQDPIRLAGINSSLKVSGNNLADLFYLTAIPLPPTPPYSLAGKLVKKGDVWVYQDFAGKVGDSDLAGTLAYDVSGDRGFVKANLVSKFLDMDDMGGFVGAAPSVKAGETAAPEQKVQAAEEAASPRILPDMKLDLSRLRATDMQVKLAATKVNAPGWPISDMDVLFNLDHGLLILDPLKFGVSGGVIDGVLRLDGREDVPDVNANLNLRRLSLKGFLKDSRFETLSSGRFGGHIDLQGRGKSLAEVLGHSNGRVSLIMSGGSISLLMIEAAGIDIAEALPLLLGDDDTTRIRCAVGDFRVKDGLLYSETFVFDTTDTNIEGKAVIDLQREAIDARIEANPKDISPFAAKTPLLITGRLKSPDIGLEPGELSARGLGAAILGAVFLPAAIIPFIEPGLGEDSDCGHLIAKTESKN